MNDILNSEEAAWASDKLPALQRELNVVVFGQAPLIDHLITALIAGGHVLLEGLPGLGKTELLKGLARRFIWASNASSSLPICCQAMSPAAPC